MENGSPIWPRTTADEFTTLVSMLRYGLATGASDRTGRSVGLGGFERERSGPGFFGADGDVHVLSAEAFVPGLDGVGTRRETLQLERASVVCDVEMGVSENKKIGPHPGMNVADDRNRQFLMREGCHIRLPTRGDRAVPRTIVARDRMDVVRRGVSILHFEGLTGHHRQHARKVHAVFLIEHGGILGSVVAIAAEPGFDVHD